MLALLSLLFFITKIEHIILLPFQVLISFVNIGLLTTSLNFSPSLNQWFKPITLYFHSFINFRFKETNYCNSLFQHLDLLHPTNLSDFTATTIKLLLNFINIQILLYTFTLIPKHVLFYFPRIQNDSLRFYLIAHLLKSRSII